MTQPTRNRSPRFLSRPKRRVSFSLGMGASMSWTYEEIERSWLVGSRIAVGPPEVVAAFNRCERVMGRDWIDRAHANAPGTGPTLTVVALGQQLASLEDIANSQQLIDKLRSGDNSAVAELRAIHLLR